ncbi:antirestriction protein ArdA [Arthrobacter sp. CJ23]|uniref:antirestriction protein ArdA n=1 Tax=Arthrobacter sp. CJ23 TaxID=2972479 RepID=UPI00215C833D|nr:antirestriction protein ArdA [Arthrobacter sp. CJ23]UVJ38068.1 antirestriction protein ArdA [Arthrobacter sp. CJ23]
MNHEPAPTTPEAAASPEREATEAKSPAIYVASLADYVNGKLHGTWIDATIGAGAIHQKIQAMLAASKEPAPEEWAIHDYKDFDPLRLSEFSDIDRVAAIAEHIKKYGPAFASWLDFTDFGPADWHYFTEAYLGEYEDIEAYVEHVIDDLDYETVLDERLPESLRGYVRISKAAMARDLQANGSIFTVRAGNSIHVFNARI